VELAGALERVFDLGLILGNRVPQLLELRDVQVDPPHDVVAVGANDVGKHLRIAV